MNFPVQGRAGDAEDLAAFALVAAGMQQHALDVRGLDLVEGLEVKFLRRFGLARLGFLAGRPEFLDIALVYVLISFVSTLAVLKFCCRRHEPPDCHCKVGGED